MDVNPFRDVGVVRVWNRARSQAASSRYDGFGKGYRRDGGKNRAISGLSGRRPLMRTCGVITTGLVPGAGS
jgi:hypothetical protein